MFTSADVTLYVPCYNAGRTLGPCVEGLRRQTAAPARLLLVDDGSDEPIDPRLAPRGAEVIRHEHNQGLAAARNTALRACGTPLIGTVDADVVADPAWLEHLLAAINSAEFAGAGGAMHELHQAELPDRWRARHMAQHWGDRPVRNPRFLYGCNTLLRVDELRSVGGYDTRLRSNHEDRALCEALYALGRSLLYAPSALCRHLRRDTLAGILPSYWQWHQPVGMLRGDFDSLDKLMWRIEHVIFGIFQYRFDLDHREGRDDLLPLDAAIPWVFAQRDLAQFAGRGGGEGDAGARLPMLSLMEESMGEMASDARAGLSRMMPDIGDGRPCDSRYVDEFRRCLRDFNWRAAGESLAGLVARGRPLAA